MCEQYIGAGKDLPKHSRGAKQHWRGASGVGIMGGRTAALGNGLGERAVRARGSREPLDDQVMADTTANSGQRPTVEQLLLKHAVAIRRIIERRSGPLILKQTTVDDLYQESAAAAMASSDTYRYANDAQFVSWISTIARRAIARQLRNPRRGLDAERIRGAASSGSGVPESCIGLEQRTPSSSAAGHEGENRLRCAIRSLPSDYRMVITLYKLEERSLADVAACMGRTKGATCRLLARATDVLREKLGEP